MVDFMTDDKLVVESRLGYTGRSATNRTALSNEPLEILDEPIAMEGVSA